VGLLIAAAALMVLGSFWRNREQPDVIPVDRPPPAASIIVVPIPVAQTTSAAAAPSAAPDAGKAQIRSTPRKPQKKLPANCFTVDKDGVLHPKPECMK
jgi:hypothetical protein